MILEATGRPGATVSRPRTPAFVFKSRLHMDRRRSYTTACITIFDRELTMATPPPQAFHSNHCFHNNTSRREYRPTETKYIQVHTASARLQQLHQRVARRPRETHVQVSVVGAGHGLGRRATASTTQWERVR